MSASDGGYGCAMVVCGWVCVVGLSWLLVIFEFLGMVANGSVVVVGCWVRWLLAVGCGGCWFLLYRWWWLARLLG